MTNPVELPPARVSALRMAVRIAALALLVGLVYLTMGRIMVEDAVAEATGKDMHYGLLFITLAIYAIFLALPFVPGVEIGLTMLVLGGASLAPFVYGATVAGLVLAFLAGRFLGFEALHTLFADLRMRRVCALLSDLAPLSGDERLARLRDRLPAWAQPLTGRGRYVLVALLLVLPGNAVLGGGGGICLAAGLTRLFSTPGMIATIAVAVAPVPILVWAFDLDLPALPF